MPKPLVSSSFFSFPKFLLWSLPLIFLAIYTWLAGGFNATTVRNVSATVSAFLQAEETALKHLWHNGSIPVVHDESFTPDFILRVAEAEFTQSCITKPHVVLINGTSPGPELRFVEGNIYWVRVYNDMDHQNLTMHWHGLSMAASPFSDGTPGASQWPIPPNHYFDYEIETTVGMSGTYMYHSHVMFQAVSAAGPLIVEDAGAPPYRYDDERLIALQDVFLKTDTEVEDGLLGNPFQWSGESANILINGQGQMPGNASSPGCELAVINVEPDKTYRLRFIGGTALSFMSLAFEDHDDLIVIEADGEYTKPAKTSHLQIGSGQRFSVLFKTKSRAELSKQQFYMQVETRDRPSLTRSFAVLSYQMSNSKRIPNVISRRLEAPTDILPVNLPPTTLGWLDYQLEALFPSPDFPTSSEVTRRVVIRTHQIIGKGTVTWEQDAVPWIETFPTEPYLVSLYRSDGVEFPSMDRALANGGIDPITRVFPAKLGEVIEIIIQNTGSDVGSVDTHPFHAHGSHYYDLGSGNMTYDPVENEKKIAGLNLPKRDTTMLYKYTEHTTPGADMGWRAWRVRVTQPGVWMTHCHILQHMVMGMQTVWVVGDEAEVTGVPFKHIQGYLDFGGSVYGNDTHHAHVVHFKGPSSNDSA